MTYNKKVDLSNVPFSFGIDASGNYGYIKDGADTVIPFKSQSDIDNAYNKGKDDGSKIEYEPIFRASGNKVGDIGKIIDGTYNRKWIIYSISGNTYQLFPMQNLTTHVMNSNGTNTGGYNASEMYIFVHNTVLPNLRRSGLNIVTCDLVSKSVYNDIWSKTGMAINDIAGGAPFWVTDPDSGSSFCFVDIYGYGVGGITDPATTFYGVRPLITVVK